jgi:hypothetical protein
VLTHGSLVEYLRLLLCNILIHLPLYDECQLRAVCITKMQIGLHVNNTTKMCAT